MSTIEKYYCRDCKVLFDYFKPRGEDFPKNPVCSVCGSTNTVRNIDTHIKVKDN